MASSERQLQINNQANYNIWCVDIHFLTKQFHLYIFKYRFIYILQMKAKNTDQQKKLLTQILSKLSEDRLPAKGLLMLVEQWKMSANTIQALMHVVSDAIQNVTDEWLRLKLTKTQTLLENIARLESESRLEDEKEMELLMEQMQLL